MAAAAMSRGALWALAGACFALGVADLGVLNAWLVPAAWPEPSAAAAARESPEGAESRPDPSAPSAPPAVVQAAPTVSAPPAQSAAEPADAATAEPESPPVVAAVPYTPPSYYVAPPRALPTGETAGTAPSVAPASPKDVVGFSFLAFRVEGEQDLSAYAKHRAKPYIAKLKEHPEFVIQVEGRSGQAKALAEFLEHHGIEPSRIKFGGAGAAPGGSAAAEGGRVVVRVRRAP